MDSLGVEVSGGFAAFEIVLMVEESDMDVALARDAAPIRYRLFRYILMHGKLHRFLDNNGVAEDTTGFV